MTRAQRRELAVQRAEKLAADHAVNLGDLGILRPGDLYNQCLKVTRSLLGVNGRYASARVAWTHVAKEDRHPSRNAPAGVPGWFAVGEYWHSVLMDTDGHCWSSDIRRRGHYDRVPVSLIEQRWGARWLGWSETINGQRVYGSDN